MAGLALEGGETFLPLAFFSISIEGAGSAFALGFIWGTSSGFSIQRLERALKEEEFLVSEGCSPICKRRLLSKSSAESNFEEKIEKEAAGFSSGLNKKGRTTGGTVV